MDCGVKHLSMLTPLYAQCPLRPTQASIRRCKAQAQAFSVEPPTTEVTGFLLHRPLPLLVLHGFHRRNFRQFLPYKLMLTRVYNTQSFF